MKYISILLSISLFFIACKNNEKSNNEKEHNIKLKRYEVKSGMVEYKMSLSGEIMGGKVTGEGTQSLYFNDWGALETRNEEYTQSTGMEVFGQKKEEKSHTKTMTKLDKGKTYFADYDKKQISVFNDQMTELAKQHGKDAAKTGKALLEQLGGKIVGQEELLGYSCDIWDITGEKQWIYKGVMLKLEMTVMGITTSIEATSAKFDTDVSNSYFELPDFPISEEEIMDNTEFQHEMDNMNEEINKLSQMNFEEWKKTILSNTEDEAMQNMSEEELKKAYDLMKSMTE